MGRSSSRLLLGALATVTLGACASAPLRMRYRTVDSPAMGRPMQYGVWAPRDFRPGESLPLFLFLHGGGDDARCLDLHGISARLDEELEQGRIPRVVVLVPDGDQGFWADWADGTRRYESWVLKEALPRVAREYGTGDTHLFGISMGGNGTLRWALKHPGRFQSASVLSGPTPDAKGMERMINNWFLRTFMRLGRVFGRADDGPRKRQADPFQRWRSPEDLHGLKLFIAHGDGDRAGIVETNAALHAHLEQAGIPHRYLVFHGGHRWQDWKPLFGEAIRFGLAPLRLFPPQGASDNTPPSAASH